MASIWKDYYFTIAAASAEYRVHLNNSSGAVIYQGKAYARPGESSVKIKINDIVADYIRQSLPVIGQTFVPSAFSMTFYLEHLVSETWTSDGTVTFDWDWSQDPNFVAATDGYSFPVLKTVNAFQYLPVTVTTASTTATIKHTNGTSESVTVTSRTPSSFNTDLGTDYNIFEQSPLGAAVLDLSQYSDVESVTIGGKTFKVVDCHELALYYVNEYGGWDTLLLEGRSMRSSSYERFTSRHDYDNTNVRARGERNYINVETRSITLRTGWIDDEGSARIHNLIGSTMVYLHDFTQDTIIPIVIDDTEVAQKTIASEGGIVTYDIIAHIAREKSIR